MRKIYLIPILLFSLFSYPTINAEVSDEELMAAYERLLELDVDAPAGLESEGMNQEFVESYMEEVAALGNTITQKLLAAKFESQTGSPMQAYEVLKGVVADVVAQTEGALDHKLFRIPLKMAGELGKFFIDSDHPQHDPREMMADLKEVNQVLRLYRGLISVALRNTPKRLGYETLTGPDRIKAILEPRVAQMTSEMMEVINVVNQDTISARTQYAVYEHQMRVMIWTIPMDTQHRIKLASAALATYAFLAENPYRGDRRFTSSQLFDFKKRKKLNQDAFVENGLYTNFTTIFTDSNRGASLSPFTPGKKVLSTSHQGNVGVVSDQPQQTNQTHVTFTQFRDQNHGGRIRNEPQWVDNAYLAYALTYHCVSGSSSLSYCRGDRIKPNPKDRDRCHVVDIFKDLGGTLYLTTVPSKLLSVHIIHFLFTNAGKEKINNIVAVFFILLSSKE